MSGLHRHIISMLVLACASACFGASPDIQVRLLPEHSGATVPIAVKVDQPVPGYCLQDASTGRLVPFQYDKSTGTLEFLIDVPPITKPTTVTFRQAKGKTCGADHLRIDGTQPKSLVVREGDTPVFAYNYGVMLPEGVPADRRRSSYIHPLFGPYGEVLTDDFPVDHYHHRGIGVMWTNVTVGGVTYDYWTLKGMRPKFGKVLAMEDGPVYALLQTNDGWYTDAGVKVVDEVWTVKAYRAGDRGRIIDFDIVLKAVGEPVTVRSSDRGYGGFNIRFAPRTDTVLFSENGRVAADTDKVSFLWNDLSAKFKGADAVSGVAIFDNPANVRHPQPWSNRYYGFLNPAPAAIEPLTFTSAEPLRLQYRMWVHSGDAEAGGVAQAYQSYVAPPVVGVKGGR